MSEPLLPPPNKRLKLTGDDRFKGTRVLCAGAHNLSFNDTAPGGRVVLALGLLLFLSSLRRLAAEGRGTLAPWDPPRQLVVRGPYRFVRNPMISGVVFILVSEAMLLTSRPHALWALTFLGINLVYIPLLEEPMLRLRFGKAYLEYSKHVPRIFPRITPWSVSGGDKDAA